MAYSCLSKVRVRFALLAALLLCSAQPITAADGEKYALLVGVKTYIPTELKKLKYTENDVTELEAALTTGGYSADNIRLLTQTAAENNPDLLPTGKNIAAALEALALKCKPGDSLLVAFAGHGVQYQNSDESYFCPMDAKLADKTTLVAFGDVGRQLEQCKASFKLLLVDACRNDPLADTRSVEALKLESVTRPPEKLRPGGTAILFSCSAGEKAFEDADLKHGVFFHFVIEGLRGEADQNQDGIVVLPELEIYTKERVLKYVKDKFQTEQNPALLIKKDVMGLAPIVTVSRERASLSSYVETANSFRVTGNLSPIGISAVSTDGKTVVLRAYVENASENQLSIWDVSSKKEITKMREFLDNGLIPPISPDGKLVASQFFEPGGPDGVGCFHALIFDRAAGKVKADFKSKSGEQWWDQVALAPNGSILCWSSNRVLRRLDAATGAFLPVVPKGGKSVSSVVAISANAEMLARLVGDKNLEIWDAAQGRMLFRSSWAEADKIMKAGGHPMTDLFLGKFLLAPDGKSLLEIEPYIKHRITIWDTATGKERCTIPFTSITGVCPARMAICSDGKTLVTRYDSEPLKSFDEDTSHLKFFDLTTGKERPNSTRLDRVMDFALSPDGAKMATLHKLSAAGKEWVVKVGDLPASVQKK